MTAAPPRPSMSQARRARLFLAHEGRCGLCGEKIIGPYEIEHRIPWALSYDDSDANLYPVHPAGHKAKTREDVKAIAKAKRQGGETGQAARRARNGAQLKSRGFEKGAKRKIPSRGFDKKPRPFGK